MDSLGVKLEEMIAREVRAARTWLISVAVVSFGHQLLFAYHLPPKVAHMQRFFVTAAIIQLAVFFGLWLFTYRRPKLSLVFALAAFWVDQTLVLLRSPPEDILSPVAILFRLAFTLGLIGGISAASRSEELQLSRAAPEASEIPDGA